MDCPSSRPDIASDYLIPGSGLSLDERTWISSGPEFFLAYQPLVNRFRILFAQKLKKQAPELHAQIPKTIWSQPWKINLAAAGSGQNALRYLARYVFKTATGNRRLHLLPDGQVRWPYRSSQTGQWTHQDFTPEELIRRFVQLVLPQNYCRVRCFGWPRKEPLVSPAFRASENLTQTRPHRDFYAAGIIPPPASGSIACALCSA